MSMALLCEWLEPLQTNAPIQFYNAKIIQNGVVVVQTSTKTLKMSSHDKLTQGEIYTVSVRAVTNTEGPAAETYVNFTNSGKTDIYHKWTFKLRFVLIIVSFNLIISVFLFDIIDVIVFNTSTITAIV